MLTLPSDLPEIEPALATALRAALLAGNIIRAAAANPSSVQAREKRPNDFVTEVDLASEQAIVQTLLGAYPHHAVRTEESAKPHGQPASDHVWIVDPLDGTTNFIHAYPQVGVSIALAVRGRIAHAVVLDVMAGEWYHASRGQGAFRGASRLQVSRRGELQSALLATSCPARAAPDGARALELLCDVMGRVAAIRRSGSAALDLARIAAGQCDGGFDLGLNAWDVAAGSLLVQEAGGRVGDFCGASDFLEAREIVSGAPAVFDALVAVLAPYSRRASACAGKP
ncbi:inositol monophosphatase family protein [Comamonadaceae bacterium G21597-S1]|nr:inositol monophosphatase family protein [Comamonadaceae bacterium G21597-S1]